MKEAAAEADAQVIKVASPAKASSPAKPSPGAQQAPAVVIHAATSADEEDLVPVSLPSHLIIVQQIGSGAYGDVLLCDNARDGSQVAVKCIRDFTRDPLFGKRIYREIRLLAAMKHQNVLKLVDIVPVPSPQFDDVYIVMPYMDLDLNRVIYSKMGLALTEKHAQAFSCQILRGLKYLHSAGVVHRDLKPANILVNKDCTLRIADLGLARGRTSEEEVLTEYVVTRWYRSPELMLHPSGYFEAVDIWSVGCIHVELLNRRPLFPGDNNIDMLRRIAGVLGFSGDSDLAWLPSTGSEREGVLKLVETIGLSEAAAACEHRLEQLVPEVEEQCVGFVRKLLTFNPALRISASDALAHQYLEHLSDPTGETTAREPFAWDFDNFEPTKQALQDRIYMECARFHPEILARDGVSGELAAVAAAATSNLPVERSASSTTPASATGHTVATTRREAPSDAAAPAAETPAAAPKAVSSRAASPSAKKAPVAASTPSGMPIGPPPARQVRDRRKSC
mmetsp:Transcript_71440/g.127448  ORF Transcript_71440/g.127448 Transcript_71440/m.127448 type:complete len:508 (-) Transcript_71440:32-1555(-)